MADAYNSKCCISVMEYGFEPNFKTFYVSIHTKYSAKFVEIT